MIKHLENRFRILFALLFWWGGVLCGLAQINEAQIEAAKSKLSPEQIEQLRNNPSARQEAIRQAKAAGATDEQIAAQLDKMNTTSSSGESKTNVAPHGEKGELREYTQEDPISTPPRTTLDFSHVVFGREIFSNKNLTFSPSLNIATPRGYRLAPGDEVILNVWGASQSYDTYTLSPEGTIVIEDLGPVNLSGLSISEAQEFLKNELSRLYQDLLSEEPATFMSLSLGNIRSIRVNIVGEVVAPGSYTLPSLATLFNALYLAGGVNDIGSLRHIRVFRNSTPVATLDVYDYLLKGKYESNIRLEDNDMILVAPYDKLVTIGGKIKRPRIYEMCGKENLKELIEFAGNFTGDAYRDNVLVRRKNGRMYSVFNVDKSNFGSFTMQDGDSVVVDSLIQRYANRVTLKGAVYRPGDYAIGPETQTLRQVLRKAEGLKPEAYRSRALLSRLLPDDSRSVMGIDLNALETGSREDIVLQSEDILTVASIFDLREKQTLTVQGAVNKPAILPFEEGMQIGDAILRAGGLTEAAALINIEVSRRRKNPLAQQESEQLAESFVLQITPDLKPVNFDTLRLQPFDVVNVRFSPGYEAQQSVSVNGEVLFTGTYVMARKNERLSDLINKSGGLTANAYVEGASLQRLMNENDQLKIKAMLDLSGNTMNRSDSLPLQNLNLDRQLVGINLQEALRNPGGDADITLIKGDVLFVPRFMSTVRINGAVIYPNTVSYEKGKSLKYYLAQAGSYTDRARKRPIVIYANGKVGTTRKVLFWKRYPRIEPGCEVLIPMKSQSQSRMGLAEVLSLISSTTNMAAVLTALLK